MKINGQYVGLGLDDVSEEIRNIKSYMRRKFSYAKLLADTPVYDGAMTAAVSDMQSRYSAAGLLPPGKFTAGIINAETKYVMGYLPRPVGPDTRPVLFTVCGTGVPWWVGPDADTARAVSAKYIWQPIGYEAQPFPMGPSIAHGRAELGNQFNIHRAQIEKYGAALAGYSQGAVVTSEFWEYDVKAGEFEWAKDLIRKAVAWGNPMREKNKSYQDPGAPMAPAGSKGITGNLMVDTPDWWRNYAHQGDLYTDVRDDESGEDKTAIWQIIRGTNVFSGPDSLLAQFLEIAKEPIPGAIGAFRALLDAGMFFGQGTTPHLNYNVQPAINYLNQP